MGYFDILSWPQEEIKKRTSFNNADETEWVGPEGMSPEMYAGLNTAGDIFADPLNLIPGGALAKGSKLAKAAGHVPGSGKGMLTGSTSNYIDNFYGLTDGAATSVTPAEKVLIEGIMRTKGLPFNQALALVRKAKGMGSFAVQGVANATKNAVSPKARALHKEQGINPAVQKIIKDMDLTKQVTRSEKDMASRANKGLPYESFKTAQRPREVEKAAANVNYLNHMHEQSGRVGPLNPAMKEIAERSNLETYTANKPGVIKDWMAKNAGTEADGTAVKLPEADAQHLEDYIQKVWGGSEKVVMKRARSGTGGNHFNDMYGGKLAPIGPIREAFQKSPDDIAGYLNKKYPDGGKNWRVDKMDPDGSVWLRSAGRNVGSAVTEGGVNWTMKIDPDGTLMSVISDKHDFLEKTPGLGKALGEALPNDLVAMTPPMFSNIKKIRAKQFKGDVPERAVSGVQRKKGPKEATNLTLLEDFASATPSEIGVNAERFKNAGMLSGAAITAGKLEEND